MTTPDLGKLSIDRNAPASRRRRLHPGRWIAAILIGAVLVILLARYFDGARSVETVNVTTAYPAQAITQLNATGYVVAQRQASIASKATGRLEWLGVIEGSHVKKDEVIARLESRDVGAKREQAAAEVKVAQANIEQARAELRDAQSAYQRSEELIGKHFISASAHDAARARFDKAKAGLSSQQAELAVAQANYKAADVEFNQTLIRAPFDGVVLTKNANVGDNITPFSNALDTKGAVITMADMNTLEVEADVAESSLSKIHIGQPCEIQLDALPDKRLAGVVNRIVPTVDRAKATVLVKVRFVERDARVLPDMSARVAFLERALTANERQPLTAVPAAAVLDRNGQHSVLRVRDGRAQRVSVSLGVKLGDLVQISGVQVGDKVVLKPLDADLDGRKVKVAQQP